MRYNQHVEFDAQRDIRSRTVRFYMMNRTGDTISYPEQVVMKTVPVMEYESGAADAIPLIETSPENLSSMMDCLWREGVRPTNEQKFGNGEREVLHAHIASLLQEVMFLRGVVNHQLGRIS